MVPNPGVDVMAVQRFVGGVVLFGAMLGMPSISAAQEQTEAPASSSAATTAERPTAESIIERFIDQTGGRQAWESITSLRGMGHVEVLGTPVTGYITIDQTEDDFRMSVEIPGAGSRVTLRVGEQAWSIGPDGQGIAVTGDQLKQLVRERDFNPLVDAADHYSVLELMGVEQVEDSQAWKIRCVAKNNPDAQEIRFFDIATGMQVKVIEQSKGATIPTEIYLADYRQVGSIKIACSTNIGTLRQRMLITMDAMQVNAAVPSCLFEPPASVIDPTNRPSAAGPG